MAFSDRADRALRRSRLAYEYAHAATAVRGVAVAGALAVLAFGLHQMSPASWLVAAVLAVLLAALGWRGGAWRRGALAGVIAGLPPLIAPSVVFALSHGGHCTTCEHAATVPCLIACFGSGSLVGILMGYRVVSDPSPGRFALAATAAAALTGLLSCGTTGLGGALGVIIGLVGGGLAGWVVAARTAHV